PHAARAVHHAALREARARDRPGDRVQAGRLHRRGGERGAPRGAQARRIHGAIFRARGADPFTRRGARALAAALDRWPGGRRLSAEGRAYEPGRHDPGARPRCARRRGAHRREPQGHGDPQRARAGKRCRDRSGRGACRRRGELRGPGSAGVRVFFNGPESFTPDDRYLLGEARERRGLYVEARFNSLGIQSAGGAGKVLADWILDGHPPFDLWDVDIRRCAPFQRNRRYLRERTVETLGLLYAMHWPYRQAESARGVRRSVVHDRLAAAGACFGEVAGYERANWFATGGAEPRYAYSYGRQNWFEHSAGEHRAVRERAGLFDQSSFSKFAILGPDAAAALGRICAYEVDVPVGRIVYTQWLNERGGIEADLT